MQVWILANIFYIIFNPLYGYPSLLSPLWGVFMVIVIVVFVAILGATSGALPGPWPQAMCLAHGRRPCALTMAAGHGL